MTKRPPREHVPIGWKVSHFGKGRGVYTRVEFSDGRGINFSGRLPQWQAVHLASEQLRQWAELDMTDIALASFGVRTIPADIAQDIADEQITEGR